MSIIVGGHNLGLLDSSQTLLGRDDRTQEGSTAQGMETFANVSNGNLLYRERDAFLPSRGEDFTLVRTYNSRGMIGGSSDGWRWSSAVQLSSHQDKLAGQSKAVTNYSVVYGDGSELHFEFDASRNLWVSPDGSGAFETLRVLAAVQADGTKYVVTRADQTRYNFDKNFVLLSTVDTNGVRMDYEYAGGRVARIRDDTGYVIGFLYDGLGKLASVTDNSGSVLVRYTYTSGLLSSVTDRMGHVTTYDYNSNGLLQSVTLPDAQVVGGQLQSFASRQLRFTYEKVTWGDTPHVATAFDTSTAWIVRQIQDAEGGITTFDYNFSFASTGPAASDRDARFQFSGSRYFTGATTRVVDALGNARATSNDAEYVAWRQANGYYATYDATAVAATPALKAQFDAIRNGQSLVYVVDADGYITQVTDALGYQTTYTYDLRDNLTAVTDRNGYGAANSDAPYFRTLRKDLGYVDIAGNGKTAGSLTAAEKTALLARFTTRFTYDANGNVLSRTDNAGNVTTFTYTAFNRRASETAPLGNSLSSADDAQTRQKRIELGYPGPLASLTAAQKTALKALYTTTYAYDSRQNLVSMTAPGGDVTRYEYDAFGNRSREIVVLDPADPNNPAKQQVTTFSFDAFGNNVLIVDPLGRQTQSVYDKFGNLSRTIDARGGVTTYTYDADNRLLSTVDAEGNVTVNAYDAVGNRIAVTDEAGHTITYVYNRNNLLVAVSNPAAVAAKSRATTFTYDVVGNRTSFTDAEGRRTTYTFDARRQQVVLALPAVPDATGATASYRSSYAYDGEGNVVTYTDANGNVTQTAYTVHGLIRRRTDAAGTVTEFTYDANRRTLQVVIGAQLPVSQRRVLGFGYDEEDQLVRETDPLNGVRTNVYDAVGNRTRVTDENGNATDFEYDRNNRLLKETRAAVVDAATGLLTRHTVLHQYDELGNEVATTDENLRVTRYAYDRNSRQVLVTDANNLSTVFAYDSRGNRTQVAIGVRAHVDASGQVVIDDAGDGRVATYVYDEFYQQVAETDGVGNALAGSDAALYQQMRVARGLPALAAALTEAQKTALRAAFTERFEYDRVGNLVRETDHLGRATAYAYDALDRLVTTTEADGTAAPRVASLQYDGKGNAVRVTDTRGFVSTQRFDALDRLVETVDTTGVSTTYEYDAFGSRTAMTRAAGTTEARTWRYVYDLNGRLTEERSPGLNTLRYEYDAVGQRTRVTDERGYATQYGYDARGRTIRIVDPQGFQTRYEYDGAGNRLSLVDARGGVTRYTYDPGNRNLEITTAGGRVTRFSYDTLGRATRITTAAGLPEEQVTTRAYDAEGNLRQTLGEEGESTLLEYDDAYQVIRTTDGNGHATLTTYDALGRAVTVRDPLGNVTTFRYDAADNVLTRTDALGRSTSFAYDALGRAIVETDATGVETRYRYDRVGNRIEITRAANRPEAATRTFQYDADNRRVGETDFRGNATTYVLDASGRVTARTDANLHTAQYRYDERGLLVEITDPESHRTTFAYDGNGNRIRVTDARLGATTTWYGADNEILFVADPEGYVVGRRYDGNNNVIEETAYATPLAGPPDPAVTPVPVTGAEDRTVRYQYDGLNRVAARIDAEGGTRRYTYDAVGNLIATEDENGHTTTRSYDDNDRLVTETDALGESRRYTYDAVGALKTSTDARGFTTTYAYDANARLTTETNPLGDSRAYTYDAVGNRRTVQDERGNVTTYAYDRDDRLVSVTDALGGVRGYTYDAVGNRLTETDENGYTTAFGYDGNDRLVLRTDARGETRQFVYDAAGNLQSETDENHFTTRYAYDRNNRLIRRTDPRLQERLYGYDAVGNRTSETDENGHTVSFAYDGNGRLVSRVDARGEARSYAYDAAGNLEAQTDENGHTTRYEYDAANRLAKQIDARGGERTYGYDAAGNRLRETDENGHATAYTFDGLNRVTSKTDARNGVERYGYDAAGNRTSVIDARGFTTTYAFDAIGRMSARTDARGGLHSWDYDAAGNLLAETDENRHVTRYTYDELNRNLTRTDALGGVRRFTYDGAGNLATSEDERGHVTHYAYDENNRLASELDPMSGLRRYAYDGAGNRIAEYDVFGHETRFGYDENNRLVTRTDATGHARRYGYDAAGNRTSVQDENGGLTRFEYDGLGWLTKITDALGYTTEFTYDAAGNRLKTAQALSLTDPLRIAVVREAYDELNRKVAELSAEGWLETFTYDAAGHRTAATRYSGRASPTPLDGAPLTGPGDARTTQATYDALGRKTTETSAGGVVTRYEYDAVGNRTAKVEADGTLASRRTEIEYDAANRVRASIDALGVRTETVRDAAGNATDVIEAQGRAEQRATHYVYDDNNRVSSETDALGTVTRNFYDVAGNLRVRIAAFGLPEERIEHFEYDVLNRKTAETNGAGGRTEFEYDGVGRRIRMTVAPGLPEVRTTRYRYDLDGRLVAEIDGNGVETRHTYDGSGNRVETLQLAAAFDAAGNALTEFQGRPVAAQTRQTTFSYDLDGRLVTVTDPRGGRTTYEYDVLGNQIRITDANGNVVENTFDADGRLTRNLLQGADRGGILVQNQYDAFGNIVLTQRGFADGSDMRQTTYEYDARDRQTAVNEFDLVPQWTAGTVPVQAYSTTFRYDVFGNQTSVTRGVYHVATDRSDFDAARAAAARPLIAAFTYDAGDRLASTQDGEGNVIAYYTDAFGNRTEQTTGFGSADARTVLFFYDGADRLIRRETPEGGVALLFYDSAGNQVEQSILQRGREGGTGADVPIWARRLYRYDGNGRLIEEFDPLRVSTQYTLDAFGNVTQIAVAAGTDDERVRQFRFDAGNALIGETDPMGSESAYEVDALGNRVTQTVAGRTTRLYYDSRNLQSATLDPEGYLTVFERDSQGNVTAVRTFQSKYPAPADGSVPEPLPVDVPRTLRYEYDAAGDRVREIDALGAITEYAYDSARNRVKTTQFGSADTAAIARTAIRTPRVQTFQYDLAGRLVGYTGVDGTVEAYGYDAANNRTSQSSWKSGEVLRETRFAYDRDSRETSRNFDPAGLALVQTLMYDKAGNVVARTDAGGNTTHSAYDLAGRLSEVTDALGNSTRFTYDRAGNQTSVTDARGNVTYLTYDLDDRLIREELPAVDVFTIEGGLLAGVSPARTFEHDAAGNVVQTTDASGHRTTSYYDGNNLKVAEIDGDGVLRTFAYDASGLLTEASLYMTRLPASAHDPNTRPAVPPGEVRTIRSEYDAAGHVVRRLYPAITVTTLSGTDGTDPAASTATVSPEERNEFDAFGNLVVSYDRNGGRTLGWFDARGRLIATADAAGYYTETDYDSQDNVVAQRKYEQPLTASQLNPGALPGVPAGAYAAVNRIYDAANRLVEEASPPLTLALDGGAVGLDRPRTRYVHDAVGNVIARTVAYGTDDAATEYYAYDAANRQVAVLGAGRTLNVFAYDASGNKTSQTRYLGGVADGVAHVGVTADELLAAVVSDPAGDETTDFAYDALGRLVRQTDRMGVGSDDDIVQSTDYDANGLMTRRTDALGNQSRLDHDAGGRITQTLTPNGAASFIEYDAAGAKIRAWTGGLPNSSAQQATNVAASIGRGVTITWNQPGQGAQSWVVWDTVAHDIPDGATPQGVYGNETPRTGSGAVGTTLPSAALPPGTTVYFRVVSLDVAGNLAWTEERTLVVPASVNALSVSILDRDLVVRASFASAVTHPVLAFGPAGGSLTEQVDFIPLPDGDYLAFILGQTDPQSLAFQVRWNVGAETFTSAVTNFEAGGSHTAVGTTVAIPVPQVNSLPVGEAQRVFVDHVLLTDGAGLPAGKQVNDQLQFDPQLTTNGTHRYDAYIGTEASTTHAVTITSTAHQSTEQNGADTLVRDSNDEIVSKVRHMRWVQSYQTDIAVTLGASETPAGPVELRFKTAAAAEYGLIRVLPPDQGTWRGTLDLDPGTYDLAISYPDAEGRQVIVEWRRIVVSAADLPADFEVTDNTPPFDFAGQEAQLALTADVADPAGARSYTGRSMTVEAGEIDGAIDRRGSGRLQVDPGLYIGPLGTGGGNAPIVLGTSASSGSGSVSTDGLRSKTYYTEIRYDALGHKIATNEDSGLWRTFGVDRKGNVVQTSVFGTEAAQLAFELREAGNDPRVSYAAFDARDLEVATFGVAAPVDGQAGLVRAVTRTAYDYDRRKVSELAPGNAVAARFAYDGSGNLVTSIDALGAITTYAYNRRGQLVRRTDPEGHARRYGYDAAGNLASETSEVGTTTTYESDAFGRRTATVDPLGRRTTMTYDQHDRLVTITDALGRTSTRAYDKRDRQTWLIDPAGHAFGTAYDEMGLVTHEYSFLDFAPGSAAAAEQAVALHEPSLIDAATTYDVFGNAVAKTDAAGARELFTFGPFGRQTGRTVEAKFSSDGFLQGDIALETRTEVDRFGDVVLETSSQGQHIEREYDEAGRLEEVRDLGTGVRTTYTYALSGRRATETLVDQGQTVRSMRYTYDAAGRLVRWEEGLRGTHLNYAFDSAGRLERTYTDSGDIEHLYTHTADGRIETFDKGAGANRFEYDDAGNRVLWNAAGTIHTYTYDDANQVTSETVDGNLVGEWQYDDAGNVRRFEDGDGNVNLYDFTANNLVRTTTASTNSGTQTTTTEYDLVGRTLSQTVATNTGEFFYGFSYNAQGSIAAVTGQGGQAAGSSRSDYDVNGRLVRLDLGQGDGQDSNEFRAFRYDSDGRIRQRLHDDGRVGTPDVTTEYLYENSNPVGEFESDTAGLTVGSGDYDPVKIISGSVPAPTGSTYTVRSGDTLASIAAQLLGNPSLWFVIADANGLSGSEQLTAGTQLRIPNTVQNGTLTGDTRLVYSEGTLVGSRLPNLKTPPPPPPAPASSQSNQCAVIGAIILAVVVAVVAIALTIVTAGALAPLAAAAIGASSAFAVAAVTVAVGAAVGAVFAFGASVVTQGIQIGFGLQQEFDWKQVAVDTVVGFVGGAIGGIAQAATAAVKAAQLGVTATRLARVGLVLAEAAAEVAVEAASQAALNEGRIEQPWMLGAAAGGVVIGELLSKAVGATRNLVKTFRKAFDDTAEAAASAGSSAKRVAFQGVDGTIDAAPVGTVAKKPKDVTTLAKLSDSKLAVSSNGKISLGLTDFTDVFQASGKSASMKPGTWTDTAAQILTSAQSASKISKAPDAQFLKALKILIAGGWSKLDKASTFAYAADAVGLIKKNPVPVSELAGDAGTAPKKLLGGEKLALDWRDEGTIPAMAAPSPDARTVPVPPAPVAPKPKFGPDLPPSAAPDPSADALKLDLVKTTQNYAETKALQSPLADAPLGVADPLLEAQALAKQAAAPSSKAPSADVAAPADATGAANAKAVSAPSAPPAPVADPNAGVGLGGAISGLGSSNLAEGLGLAGANARIYGAQFLEGFTDASRLGTGAFASKVTRNDLEARLASYVADVGADGAVRPANARDFGLGITYKDVLPKPIAKLPLPKALKNALAARGIKAAEEDRIAALAAKFRQYTERPEASVLTSGQFDNDFYGDELYDRIRGANAADLENVEAGAFPKGVSDAALGKLLKNAGKAGTPEYEAALGELTQVGRKVVRGLRKAGEDSAAALRYYTGSDYLEINPWSRGALKQPDISPAKAEQLDAYQRLATTALDRLPKFEGVVLRGESLNANYRAEDVLTRFVPGKVVTQKQFWSTAAKTPFGGDVLYVVNAREGRRGVEFISELKAESEILFRPDTSFKVLRVEDVSTTAPDLPDISKAADAGQSPAPGAAAAPKQIQDSEGRGRRIIIYLDQVV